MNLNIKNFSIYSICRDIVYNAWVVVLAVLIAYMGAAVYVSDFHSDVYASAMTVSVNEKNTVSYSSATLSKTIETANVFQTIFQSDVLRAKVEELTGAPMEGSVSASVINSTNLLTLKATSSSPVGAFRTLEAVMDNYRYLTDYSFDGVVMYVLSYPTVPSYPSNSISVMSVAKKAMIIAAAVVIAAIAALSFLRDTIKSESAVKSSLVLEVFASVYHERKNKTLKTFFTKKNKKLMLTDTLVNRSYIRSFNKIAMKLDYLHNAKDKKVIMITSTNENEGKTTIAVNTAISLANRGNRVLIIDLDLRKPSIWRFFDEMDFGDSSKQIAEIIKNKHMNSVEITRDPLSGVYVLAGKRSVTHSSEYLANERFPALIKKLRDRFDYVIIDTPPYALISDAEIIAAVSDAMLLVVRQDTTAVDAINTTISALNKKTSLVGCIFNDVRTVTGLIPENIRTHLSGSIAEYF